MQSFSIELSLKLPEAFKGNNTADHIILFDIHPDMGKNQTVLQFSGDASCKTRKKTPKMGVFGYFGGTENGTLGARIKILRPLFNTNTPPKTPI